VKRAIKGIILILLQGIFLCSNVIVKAETIYDGHTIRTISIFNDKVDAPYIEIEDKHGYCYDYTKDVPEYDQFVRVEHNDDRILAILYHGYTENSESLREKYNLTEDEAIALTQAAIWYIREGWGQEKVVHPYMQELIDKGLKKEIPSKELKLEENKLKYKKIGNYYETELIGTEGFEGNFTIKTTNNAVVLDSNNRERYTYRIGESFKVRNYGEDHTDTIDITGDMNVLELDLFNSLDDSVQDVISTQYIPKDFTLRFDVLSTKSNNTKDSLVKTSDSQNLMAIIITISAMGVALYIIVKELSRNKR